METAAQWAAAYPLLILLAVSLTAGGVVCWLSRRYDAQQPLSGEGPYWLVAMGAGAVFLVIAVAMSLGSPLVRFDSLLAAALGQSMSSSLLWTLSWFTYLGNRNLLALIAVALTVWLLWRREYAQALLCAVVTGGGGLLNMAMKHSFQRIRPEHVHGYVHEVGWSFPSGHASASMAVYGFACYLAVRMVPSRWHRICLVGGATLIAAIGVSRVLLQVHYLSDVIAGFALSLAWLSLCLGMMRRWYRPRADDVGHRLR
ncbi:phosphatase PAP2 family protein [Bordetella genomosp. 4]|uniref:Acid phosphatase n=1 Tax=Bordetella genomosp. 4 TaxID=463044 RepID=A0A261U8P5_9BORD|nr:phosphatase PAP2 family protein [Bordetella genomosp. 4]OZI58306.1 acid phosphatase [Bordetella genomosp. 4]